MIQTTPFNPLKLGAYLISKIPTRVLGAAVKPVVNQKGDHLDPAVALSLSILNKTNHDFITMSLEEGRKTIDYEGQLADFVSRRGIDIQDENVAGIPIRRYRYQGSHKGTIVFIHGGGWVLGSIMSHDSTCAYLAQQTGAEVISLGYPLAPEHQFPSAVKTIDAFLDHAIEVDDIILMGDSAGGNLTLTVTLDRIMNQKKLPLGLVPLVPVIDLAEMSTDSYQEFKEGYFLTANQMHWYKNHYVTPDDDVKNPLISPKYADDTLLKQLPQTHIFSAGFDVLRDEGMQFGERLKALGSNYNFTLLEDTVHPFVNSVGLWPSATNGMNQVCQIINRMLESKNNLL
ncbi:alpha/beta hydrolase [Streptococcus pluranimalium]|uniref:alpha/beta hydrolase n=1 Tax=Streptococcus pluranimalium TaxID=82348 RepID=UPI0024154B4E|nr:alpha/beta hydrolase [Streptococcus pluranimalium]WFM79365.1 alpha/beta hydrolase [Streptococcus pluranimalium]